MTRAVVKADIVGGTPDGLERLREATRIIRASRGRRYLAKTTLEKILAQISFKGTDVPADRRGRQVQFLRGILDAAEARGCLESAHAIE